jgi:hypothetical protein
VSAASRPKLAVVVPIAWSPCDGYSSPHTTRRDMAVKLRPDAFVRGYNKLGAGSWELRDVHLPGLHLGIHPWM